MKEIWNIYEQGHEPFETLRKYYNLKVSERRLYLEKAIRAWEKIAPQGKEWKEVQDFILRTGRKFEGKLGILELNVPKKSKVVYGGEAKLEGVNLVFYGSYAVLYVKFMDYISPQLFLNIGFIDKVGTDKVKWQAVI